MKNSLGKRIISLILVLSVMLSCMTVLSYAFDGISLASVTEDTDEVVGNGDNNFPSPDGVTVLLNRSFDEGQGYSYSIGWTSTPKNHKFEVVDDGTGNNYFRMTAQTGSNADKDGYLNLSFGRKYDPLDTLVIKFDIIYDKSSGLYPDALLRFSDSGKSGGTTFRGMGIPSGSYNFFNGTSSALTYKQSGNKHNVAFKIDTVASGANYSKTVSVYVDGTFVKQYSYTSTSAYMSSIRLGFFSEREIGSVVGFDNFAIYACDTEKVADPIGAELGYTMGSLSDKIPYSQDLFMKVGVDSALSLGKKLTGVNEPVTIDGKTYIPVDVLASYLGYNISISGNTVSLVKSGAKAVTLTTGSYNAGVGNSTVALSQKVASVDGNYPVIYYNDVEKLFDGVYGSYNKMGLVVVSHLDNYATIASDMALVDIMKRFIFDSIDENKNQVNVIDFDDFTAATAQHPYLLANGEDFEYYRSVYKNGNSNPTLYAYLSTLVSSAKSVYSNYAKEDSAGNYTGPTVIPTMPHDNNITNGYDAEGGRQNGADTYTERMQKLAFGYQITENVEYALLAYDYAIALGEWDHWGPAHFLNCADAAGPFALAYDWLYNVWVELGLDVNAVRDILFTHGVLAGWYAVYDVECPWARRKDYKRDTTIDSSHFYNNANNWNAVCSSGMTAAALAIAGDLTDIDTSMTVKKATLVKNTGSNAARYPYIFSYEYVPFQELGGEKHGDNSSYADYAYDLFSKLQYTLPLYGLDFYAPDGSYVESPTYWAYSANNLFALGAYCDSVFGDDFGLVSNCWGLDETCYYALNAQSSDYVLWNYSDSSNDLVPGSISTTSFPYVAYQLGNPELAEIRKDMIASGKYSAGYLDVFYYTEGTGEFELPELQYHMASIDGYVARDSWEPGSTYIAIKGGYNDSAHGQVDSGEFVYHNNGKIWFCDIGTEGYNVAGFGGTITGYQYYRMNAEGNNTLALSSDPLTYDSEGNCINKTDSCFAGQYSFGTGYMYETGDNAHGAYALIDQTEVYYNNAISAKRGMLFTNDRKTVVIQDEVSFKEAETVYWIGHTYQDIYVTTDGKTAYMTDGESVIRVSLVSSNAALRFDVLSAYDFILQDTFRPDYATSNGTGLAESDRSVFKRLVVKCENVTSLDLAVVIEDVTGDSSMDVGYTYRPMDTWVPSADGRQTSSIDAVVDFDGNYYGYESSGSLEAFNTYFVNSNMFTVSASASSKVGDYVAVNFPDSAFNSATLAGDFIVLDMDVYTDSSTGGLGLALRANGATLATTSLTGLVTIGGNWAHVTVIASDNAVYFFKDGRLLATKSLGSVSFEDVKIAVVDSYGSGGTVSLDNLHARRIDSDNSDLGSRISAGSLQGWADYINVAREKAIVFFYDVADAAPAAYRMRRSGAATADIGDTPNVEFEFDGVFTRVYGYTFSQLSSLNYEGGFIKLYYSNEHAPIHIDKTCRIDHGDNAFRATSDNLSAFVSDGVTEFRNESITVYWHIGDTVETSKYTGITYAEYTGNNTMVGKITETVVDGKHIFNATGWSLTEDGSLASKEDMIVTSANCHFYLVDDAVDYPYFYENSKGELVAREDTSKFFTDVLAGYKRVILNSDISLSGGGNQLTKQAVIYLNGYTLSFHETDSTHMFNLRGGNLIIYGGGGAIKKTGSGNIFFTAQYKAYDGIDTVIYVEDATLEQSGTFIDHRCGHVYFKNVVLNQLGSDATTLVVQNRANSFKTDANMPKITLDGSILNSYSTSTSTYAISISKNSRLNIVGGTHINIPLGIALRLHNAYTTDGTTEDYVDYSKMSLNIEDAYINASQLYVISLVTASTNKDGVVSYSTTSTVYSNKIFDESYKDRIDEERQVHVLNMASKLKIGNNTGSTFDTIPAINIADGCVFARQNDASAPYISTTDYALVTWVAGGSRVTEYWLNGSVPTADNAKVKENLALLNASVEAGKKYSYSAGKITGNTTFEATKFNNFSINMSLTLAASMKVNIYVEDRAGVEIHGIYLDGNVASYEMTTLPDGKNYYRIMIHGVLPTTAAVQHELEVYVTDANGGISPVRIHFSVLDYLEQVLANEDVYGWQARDLMANILHYIDTAYQYAGLTDTDGYKAVKTLATNYINKVTYSVVEKTPAPDLSGVADALTSIQLQLSAAPKYRFNLAEGYTGSIKLAYTVYGETIERRYSVVDGKYNGLSYIELSLNAYDFRTDITITTAGGSGVYNLQAYYNAVNGTDSSLMALLNALYAYSEKAETYKKLSQ